MSDRDAAVARAPTRRTVKNSDFAGDSSKRTEFTATIEAIDTGGAPIGAGARAGNMLREMRLHAKLTQYELANAVGVKQSRISEIEAGMGPKGPSFDVIERVAAACGVSLSFAPLADRLTAGIASDVHAEGNLKSILSSPQFKFKNVGRVMNRTFGIGNIGGLSDEKGLRFVGDSVEALAENNAFGESIVVTGDLRILTMGEVFHHIPPALPHFHTDLGHATTMTEAVTNPSSGVLKKGGRSKRHKK